MKIEEAVKLKRRIFSAALALSFFLSSHSAVYAWQEETPQQEAVFMEESVSRPAAHDSTGLTPAGVCGAMAALQSQEAYKEGVTWTNTEPYSGMGYQWKGGQLNGANIAAVGCVAFAFILSDAAFESLPARMYAAGGFSYEDIKVGDILRVNNDAHTVIVLEISESGVVVAEGNFSGKVHWGRAISKDEVMGSASHYITRYPEGYVPPDDPTANEEIASGPAGGLAWKLVRSGTLTISGSGAMPDYGTAAEQPWNTYVGQIRKVVIENGVTGIGSCAFWNCGVLSVEIPSGVTTVGNSAFRGSSLISVSIPSSVGTVGDSAFDGCRNLSAVTVSEGVETIGQNAFHGCTGLKAIALPASIGEVGAAAFAECGELTSAAFAAGSRQVKLGDNLFTRCYKLTDVTLPQSIDRIGAEMFLNCLWLTKAEIPQGAKSIGDRAFASSGLASAIIPDSVTIIGTAAFSACPLADIYFTGTEAQWNSISKLGDTASAVSKATIHYEYVPTPAPPDETAPPAAEDVPFIDNGSGKKGWDAIREEASKASDGTCVNVNMNGTSVVPGEVFDTVKGKDVTVSFDMGDGIVWSVNGRDITADHAGDMDFSVQVGTSDIPQSLVNNVAGNRQAIQLSLAHSGDFGCSAVLSVNVGSANAGLYANLFYYNEGNRRLEFAANDQINEDGVAELTFTHASSYVIVIDGKVMDEGSGGGTSGGNGGGTSGGNGSGTPGGNGGDSSGGNGGFASGDSSSFGGNSSGGGGTASADGTGPQGTDKRSPKTGEYDIVFGGSNAAELQHGRSNPYFMYLFLTGAAGITMMAAITRLIQKRTNK